MINRNLHIISFDNPYPPDYGGVIDVFYRIKALHRAGIKIHLHYFEYGRKSSEELHKYCETIFCYKREKKIKYQLSRLPFIVKTRQHKSLLINLMKDDYPILFEGLHTCAFLHLKKLKHRKKIVRIHNIEHHYYRYLGKSSNNFFQSIFFNIEALKLKLFQQNLKFADYLLTVSNSDTEYLKKRFKRVEYIPSFSGFEKILSTEGKGDFLLFHGNLSVAENIKSLTFLLEKIIPQIPFNLVIAGKNPPKKLYEKIEGFKHIKIIASPNQEIMNKLIRNAQIILLPTFQDTGLKLKLVASLSRGRHCLVNNDMVKNTDFLNCCTLANTPKEWIETIHSLMLKSFDKSMITEREKVFDSYFNENKNSEKIIHLFN